MHAAVCLAVQLLLLICGVVTAVIALFKCACRRVPPVRCAATGSAVIPSALCPIRHVPTRLG